MPGPDVTVRSTPSAPRQRVSGSPAPTKQRPGMGASTGGTPTRPGMGQTAGAAAQGAAAQGQGAPGAGGQTDFVLKPYQPGMSTGTLVALGLGGAALIFGLIWAARRRGGN